MAETTSLEPTAQWIELRTSPDDWAGADPKLLETMLVQMQIIRSFEESVLELASEGLVHGPAHSSIGQEGGAVGSAVSLRPGDGVNGTHRGHHQFLAKSLAFLSSSTGGAMAAQSPVTPQVQHLLQRTLAEILGLEQGFSGGRGGSMHLQWLEAGALGTNAIVGGGVPLAAGNAWAQKHTDPNSDSTDLTLTYFGDGASNIGSTLETMNLAAAWKLPLCFFIENNLYAVSTHVSEVTGEARLSARGPGFGIASWRVDGMDPLAVHLATEAAAEHMRAGHGPTLIEAEVYRFFHQNGPFPGSAFGYRTKDEERSWRDRDPILRTRQEMIRLGHIDQESIDSMTKAVKAACAAAVSALTEIDPAGKNGKRRIRPELWPQPGFVDVGIRGDLSELSHDGITEQKDFSGELAERKFIDVIADVLQQRMDRDESIVVMGEDVHRLKGGTNGATRGLKAAHPTRVLGTPISENAFTGLAGGMAMDGRFKPIVEFMYADFMWVAADQLFNQIGKARHMFGGQCSMPVVLRSKVAMGTGYGSQHSMDPAGVFATQPGWRIVAASTPYDYVGLMNTALDLNDPVVVLEHTDLYTSTGTGPVNDFDYRLPVGKAAVRRQGKDVTILTYLGMVAPALEAAAGATLDAEVIDLRWLDRASIDWDTIGESVKKTNNVIIAEQGASGTGYGAWLSDEIQRRYFDHLDQPVQRVTGAESSPSISKVLEHAAIAGHNEVTAGIQAAARNLGRG
ncbi:thiamine pyrophosphate-dependent enzyme [Paeniglutamicibacter sulfureus]|uniref:alpha-ketoacid dehydrogenase subunit alpha/beta n=1 Tax=Paeniglutamicibacter sulfureus TaxID=43666 RepID=UPI002665B6C3|nr:alpha-ketoacid dehydrogenase subunit alpha/beta [Paeniglutamicibacter sulfureus]MDO2934669.1 thiamine pyrophosphate-dependent enzyme [Paeniglutamicibacter sulfureus]